MCGLYFGKKGVEIDPADRKIKFVHINRNIEL
jgi:hypothetical protein